MTRPQDDHHAGQPLHLSDSTEGSQALLREHAKALANRRLETAEHDVVADVVLVRRSDTLLAIPIEATHEVRATEFSKVPGSTEFVIGTFQIRGRTHGLVDLAPFFGIADPLNHGDRVLIALVHGSSGDMGLRIDEIVGPRQVFLDEIDEGLGEHNLGFVTHVTKDLAHVIDVERLMATSEVRL
ncbi:MAG: chemotaxis protein CheW [bacterium]|nr:chemotaxis protein CheW [bacterium]